MNHEVTKAPFDHPDVPRLFSSLRARAGYLRLCLVLGLAQACSGSEADTDDTMPESSDDIDSKDSGSRSGRGGGSSGQADATGRSGATGGRTGATGRGGSGRSGATGGAGTQMRPDGGVGRSGKADAGPAPRSDSGAGDVGTPDVDMPSTGTSVEDDGADCPVGALPDSANNSKLPDPFLKLDGTRVSSKADWRCRRQELRKLAEKTIYGTKPSKPESVTGTVSKTGITVKVTDKGKSTTFSAKVDAPSGAGPFPVVVVFGGLGADTATIKGQGVAVISYDPYVVGKEGTPRNAKAGAFYDIAGANSATGLLAAWAWGVSRIIDVLEQSDGSVLKADAVGVTGCSRFGKGAFVSGVFDQRIALTMPIESGTGGIPILRGIPSEGAQSLSSGYGEQPWLGDAFRTFVSSPAMLPIDTHEMVAMIAPRGLFIMDNPHIGNLGPKSSAVAALGGAEVYKALGAGDNITYWSDVQNGSHCATRPEWTVPLQQNLKKFLLKTANDPGTIKIHSKAAGKLSDWAAWTTPTLE